jgi:hypothetical protein
MGVVKVKYGPDLGSQSVGVAVWNVGNSAEFDVFRYGMNVCASVDKENVYEHP